MKIAGFLKQTSKDFSPLIATEIFTAGCNYKCPSCHARHIIYGKSEYSEKEVLDYLREAKGFIDGLVICGGEPTLQHDLPYFLREVRNLNPEIKIKLDTNGSNYPVLRQIIQDGIVDYVAMDIKGPSRLYRNLIGLKEEDKFDLRDNVEKAIGVIQNAPDFEFRTTIVPIDETKGMRWMMPEEITEMAEWVRGFIYIYPDKVKWYLQKFIAREKEETMNERFSKENLPQEYHKTPQKLLEEMLEAGRKTGFDFRIR